MAPGIPTPNRTHAQKRFLLPQNRRLCVSPSDKWLPRVTPAEANMELREQVLRLKADVGRERVENESLAARLAQAQAQVSPEILHICRRRAILRHTCPGVEQQ